ncbi:pantoate--beta-alanine ligase [Sporosarcina ureilytica]|uniref:Pantothenate synthetase n=1 Tax=Sporosarcina ureilytica TaxID=298596 RepID=A0A1D8JKH1_9BACL|nr:pantoate--beta-alanine ligase [Sporosarcina ureilytica]AOV09206.1 pantoate--beta-alanine ligase [Sporosarcina ureilytica]
MKIVNSIEQLRKLLNRQVRQHRTVGFVPTMGFLHEGHLALVKKAREENDIVVMSIFVNPTQFGPNEDYATYPRNEQRDVALAAEAGVDIVFMPDKDEMYPRIGEIQILPGAQAEVLCGASRSGHFDGVLKVILKLFNIVDPDRSYFGKKDAQQLAIIETFVEDFNFRTTIERVPTVREKDGLAMSSRNVRLSPKERSEAPVLYEALQLGKKYLEQGKETSVVEHEVAQLIENKTSGAIDYVALLAYPSLQPLTVDSEEAILACAVTFEKARLIDNVIVKLKDELPCSE